MRPGDWDQAIFVFAIWAIVLSPALLVLPWIAWTKLDKVKRRLSLALKLVAAMPFWGSLSFSFGLVLCKGGGIDRAFGQCGPLLDNIPFGSLILVFLIPVGAYGVLALILSAREEVAAWRARKNAV